MWDRLSRVGAIGDLSFEIVLDESDGSILIQHLDTDVGDAAYDYGQSATVGIQDRGQDTSYGLEYSCNEPAINDGSGILFSTSLPSVDIFSDGFEGGNTGNWSNSVGAS